MVFEACTPEADGGFRALRVDSVCICVLLSYSRGDQSFRLLIKPLVSIAILRETSDLVPGWVEVRHSSKSVDVSCYSI